MPKTKISAELPVEEVEEQVFNEPAELEEVDEITELETPSDLIPETLDDFLRDQFEETTQSITNESGMPGLDFLKKHFKTKSAAIRYLHSLGHSVKDIQKHLGLRYQHVRNVLTTELKRGPNERPTITAPEGGEVDLHKNLETF